MKTTVTQPDKNVQPGIRFPGDVYDRLRAEADKRGISMNELVVRGTVELLERLEPEKTYANGAWR